MFFKIDPKLKHWNALLEKEKQKEYFSDLTSFVQEEYKQNQCFPPLEKIFRALEICPFDQVKVVVLGQDPYHDSGQANGLAFSVNEGIKIPPSLRNIFKELVDDQKIASPTHGNLEIWARQGVLLLNATLTVRAHVAGSHQNRGWEIFTDKIIQTISEEKEGVVFVLWGNYAQQKIPLIDEKKHLIITSAHPSPLSAYRGFFGSKPFSKINLYIENQGLKTIDWELGRNRLELF